LHRDLKPANVLLTDDGVPMLLDFNVASLVTPKDGSKTVSVGGTLPYMSPECLEAMTFQSPGPSDVRTDLYSLGIIFYELLTGKLPYESLPGGGIPEMMAPTMLALRRHPPAPPSVLNPNVSPSVDAIVLKLLQLGPDQRYTQAEHLAEDLRRQLSHRALRYAPNTSWSERWRKWRRRNPRLTTALAVAAAALGLLFAPATAFIVRQD